MSELCFAGCMAKTIFQFHLLWKNAQQRGVNA